MATSCTSDPQGSGLASKKNSKNKKAWSHFRSRNWLALETSELLLIQSKDKPSNVLNLLTFTGVRGGRGETCLARPLGERARFGDGDADRAWGYLSTCLACLVELSLAVVHGVNIIA